MGFVTNCYLMYNKVLSNSNERKKNLSRVFWTDWAQNNKYFDQKTLRCLIARESETMDIKLWGFYHK